MATIYKINETVNVTLMTGAIGDDDREVIGTEQAEVVGIGKPGVVKVRPLHGDDVIEVHIGQLAR
ncbi:hypothetical protein I5G58_gp001 [Mycobacterium phage BirdsNest]|uniref:Uncharacterized protein n=1 Tax=Mycobacterium phage BirdsNest TaxID=2686231 RepID=A0A6B9L9A0_9CAUD|nr:hypothetical protein I5G58_gp001 [Mycobacterium phage BirdsNest]QHB37303.1 hypothetical protein PBI_BIRDSNEST_1 [Mycobacterium phage BirdsNest]